MHPDERTRSVNKTSVVSADGARAKGQGGDETRNINYE
jgi:hypothetical protein